LNLATSTARALLRLLPKLDQVRGGGG
jgi:hypothetical protein